MRFPKLNEGKCSLAVSAGCIINPSAVPVRRGKGALIWEQISFCDATFITALLPHPIKSVAGKDDINIIKNNLSLPLKSSRCKRTINNYGPNRR